MVLRVFTENDRLMSLSVRFVALVFFSNGPENADLPTDRNRSGFLRPPPTPPQANFVPVPTTNMGSKNKKIGVGQRISIHKHGRHSAAFNRENAAGFMFS